MGLGCRSGGAARRGGRRSQGAALLHSGRRRDVERRTFGAGPSAWRGGPLSVDEEPRLQEDALHRVHGQPVQRAEGAARLARRAGTHHPCRGRGHRHRALSQPGAQRFLRHAPPRLPVHEGQGRALPGGQLGTAARRRGGDPVWWELRLRLGGRPRQQPRPRRSLVARPGGITPTSARRSRRTVARWGPSS
jgi:hypothetical protein